VFNIGPLEFIILAAVGLIVFGPDKLPQLAKDAGQMLRTLRDLAQGARTQLTDELGPEFKNFNPANLNPRVAIRNAILGDDDDLAAMNPKALIEKAFREDPIPTPEPPQSTTKPTAADYDAT